LHVEVDDHLAASGDDQRQAVFNRPYDDVVTHPEIEREDSQGQRKRLRCRPRHARECFGERWRRDRGANRAFRGHFPRVDAQGPRQADAWTQGAQRRGFGDRDHDEASDVAEDLLDRRAESG
jgi:hypothetical protein